MGPIISIETATKVCSVALHVEDSLIVTQTLHVERSCSEWLIGAIEHLFAVSPYTKKDLAAVAVSSGPGSYTGLRIGVATAKGLCHALDIPLIAVNTLEAMTYGVQPYNVMRALLCPMIDARRMEVYCLLADAQGHVVIPTHTQVINQLSFQKQLQYSPILFFGDGASKCKSTLAHHSHARFLDCVHPDARYIGELAYIKFRKEIFEDFRSFQPAYLKPFQGKPNKHIR